MATALISPYAARDERTMDDAVLLLEETGHPISKSTLERQCRKRGVSLTRRGRANYASWTDVLKVHAAWVDSRDDLP
ncbi:hypothetical protein ACIQHU_38905 [Streptomyces tendae]|uniref:hypothetical protein n=1 Tax=Streptomyces tendae TaxID=1932 RepID=UPI00381DBDAA